MVQILVVVDAMRIVKPKSFACSSGSNSSKDECIEICGDRLDFGILGCDDGNLVPDDGKLNVQVRFKFRRSATCTIEKGKFARRRPYLTDCGSQICGDGLVFSRGMVFSLRRWNLISSNGCDSFCEIETGFKSRALRTSKYTCKKICGDGLDFGCLEAMTAI